MMHTWNGGWAPGGYAFGIPFGGFPITAILIGLAVFAIAVFFKMRKSRNSDSDPKERGLEILIERFSRGEIDAETFKTMKAAIDSKN